MSEATLIDRDKSPLTAVDEDAVRPADVLEDHPDTSDAAASGVQGDIVFTAAGGVWMLNLQAGADGEVCQDPAPADAPAADMLRDVVVPAPGPPRPPAATADGHSLTVPRPPAATTR
ncbi:hypothetical protein ACWEQO_34025 [Streptomyces sp. NPDC004051]